MENLFIHLTKETGLQVIQEMGWGTKNVTYDSDETRDYILHILDVVNRITGVEGNIREDAFFDDVETAEGWEQVKAVDKFRIIYADRHNAVPVLNYDDIYLEELVKDTASKKTEYTLQLNPALVKRARKLCKESGITLKTTPEGLIIDARVKSQSIYKRLQTAYYNGDSGITFDAMEVNLPTVRTYASQLGSAIMKKLRCSVSAGKITVHFKEAETEDLFRFDIVSIISKYADRLTMNDMLYIIKEETTPKEVITVGDVYKKQLDALKEGQFIMNGQIYNDTYDPPLWEQMGFASELDYTVYEERKKADLEEWTNEKLGEPYTPTTTDHLTTMSSEEANDNGSPIKISKGSRKASKDLPTGVEIVDGLKQYVISDDQDTPEDAPEDDDF